MTAALTREVYEETGLKITSIQGEDTQITTAGDQRTFSVQCIKPFATYQTLRGPVDSFGVYFICTAEGTLLDAGDDTKAPHWIGINDLKRRVQTQSFCVSPSQKERLLTTKKNTANGNIKLIL